ncbi:phosphopentomutase [Mechercharimyces sp. CAU 1602]|uniref:phosphopentomutase n=1 Tax=Mechercharimyces sp. CAU 1602 TaxID=2973933 RepID=UPI0021626FBE|nr:phosphopentomutase [Mechercharimyces sp. CAU 1602]MCS1350835.1 phosphopentomutase [Mechercharimyces sp. CAU 1602]
MDSFKRIALIVLDSVGIGALPDALEFGDEDVHTLGHIASYRNGLHMPNMMRMGLGNIEPVAGIQPAEHPTAHYGKMLEISKGKDTTTGHWELMGVPTFIPFRTYPDGFPDELILEFERRVGRKVLGNKVASGTAIIEELGEEHMTSGAVIVYTSADSVFQVAAHEEVIPLEEQYRICEIARELTLDERFAVTRVIARPFKGEVGSFARTANRKDYSVKPPHPTVMNRLVEKGYESVALGKISDIYDGEGVTDSTKTKSNMDGVDQLINTLNRPFTGLAFVNLVDFDAKYGHRRDPMGYGDALEEFDRRLPEIISSLREEDLLIITADHGNDPTYRGTDHTREYVPLLVTGPRLADVGASLGIRETFADVGATIADNFGLEQPLYGHSFLSELHLQQID